ncbi:GCN5-related N-acetyltransferase [Actinobacteria bacterium OK074]|nr:GCN5-related N-acetyltransferase [Actinobacteria bacterium OK074]
MGYLIRSIRADEWAAAKALRLVALQDPVAHLAFLETYEQAVAQPDEFWQARAAGAAEGESQRQQIIAETEGGDWAGSVVVFVEEAGEPDPFGSIAEQRQGHLVAVFVREEWRGRGVSEALFARALEWSWDAGLERVRLFVHEDNQRAQGFYKKAGFVLTGHTVPMAGDSGKRELEMEFLREREREL